MHSKKRTDFGIPQNSSISDTDNNDVDLTHWGIRRTRIIKDLAIAIVEKKDQNADNKYEKLALSSTTIQEMEQEFYIDIVTLVKFAKAIEIAQKEMKMENEKFRKWTNQIFNKLSSDGVKLNGHPTKRSPHNLNVRFDGVDGKAIINSISKKIAISAGSACTTQTVEPSHVLLSLGLTDERTHSSIRIGCGRFNTEKDIEIATEEIQSSVMRLGKIVEGKVT